VPAADNKSAKNCSSLTGNERIERFHAPGAVVHRWAADQRPFSSIVGDLYDGVGLRVGSNPVLLSRYLEQITRITASQRAVG
jgi:hypothetical protein